MEGDSAGSISRASSPEKEHYRHPPTAPEFDSELCIRKAGVTYEDEHEAGPLDQLACTRLGDQRCIGLIEPVGVYLVGWFDREKWDAEDSRLRDVPDCTLLEAQVRLDEQAAAIPAVFILQAVVLDCHMH